MSPTATLTNVSANSVGRSDFGNLIAASLSCCSLASFSVSARKLVTALCCSGKSAVSSTANADFRFGRSSLRAAVSAGDIPVNG